MKCSTWASTCRLNRGGEDQGISAPGGGPERLSHPGLRFLKETIKAMETAGLREKIKIMIGGGQIDEEIRQYVKADAYGGTPSPPSTSASSGWESEDERKRG